MTHRCGCTVIGYEEAVVRQGGCRPGMAALSQALARGVTVPLRDSNRGPNGTGARPGTLGPRAYRIPTEVQVPIGSTFVDGNFHDQMTRAMEIQGATGTRFLVQRSSYPQAGVATAHGFDEHPGVMDVLATMEARERTTPASVRVDLPPMPNVPYHTRGQRSTAQVRPMLPGTPAFTGVPVAGGLVMGTASVSSTRTHAQSARPAADVHSGTRSGAGVLSPFAGHRTLAGVEDGSATVRNEGRGLESALLVNTWVWTAIGGLSLVGVLARLRRKR